MTDQTTNDAPADRRGVVVAIVCERLGHVAHLFRGTAGYIPAEQCAVAERVVAGLAKVGALVDVDAEAPAGDLAARVDRAVADCTAATALLRTVAATALSNRT